MCVILSAGKRIYFILLASSFMFPIQAFAQCINNEDCVSLGYKETTNRENCLKCPFGEYWFCPRSQCDSSYKYTCDGYLQSPSGTACNGKYQKCNCSNNYIWNASQGICLACTSPCIGYTLTYTQAVQQCGASSVSTPCLNICTGDYLYKCISGGTSGSGSGSDVESGCFSGGIQMDVGDMTCRHTSTPESDGIHNCNAGDANGNGYTVKIAPVVSSSACVAGYAAGSGDIQTALQTCKNLKVNGVTGWYLPSKDILYDIDEEHGLGGVYWSSSTWGGSGMYLPFNGPTTADQNTSYKIYCVHDIL